MTLHLVPVSFRQASAEVIAERLSADVLDLGVVS